MMEMLKEKSGTEPLFRISESPIFLSESFRQKLQDASESIINQIENFSLEELSKAIPEKISVPNDTEKPHFLAIDFGICKNDSGEIVPQLIELQAFPTLYAFQKELNNAYAKVYPFLNKIDTNLPDDDYFKDLEFLEPNIIDLGEIDFKEIKKKD